MGLCRFPPSADSRPQELRRAAVDRRADEGRGGREGAEAAGDIMAKMASGAKAVSGNGDFPLMWIVYQWPTMYREAVRLVYLRSRTAWGALTSSILHVPFEMRRHCPTLETSGEFPLICASWTEPASLERIPFVAALAGPFTFRTRLPPAFRAANAGQFWSPHLVDLGSGKDSSLLGSQGTK